MKPIEKTTEIAEKIKVHIVDDHQLIIDGLVPLINNSGKAVVDGTSNTLNECRSKLAMVRPDVLLLDLRLKNDIYEREPDDNGIVFCKEMNQKFPKMKIIVMSMYDDKHRIELVLKNGAKGYIMKNCTKDELLEAIVSVNAGGTYFCEKVEKIINSIGFNNLSLTVNPVQGILGLHLTKMEYDVLELLEKDYSTMEMSRMLNRTINSIASSSKTIRQKMNVNKSSKAVKLAKEMGLLPRKNQII
jgi:DNA-binding NarL/FixJ family response regulator